MIEAAKIDDAPEILDVINKGNRVYKKVIPKKYYKIVVISEQELLEDMKRMTFYVYRKDGKVVAVCALFIENEDLVRLRWVYVLPEYQRMGIGKAMVRFLEGKARILNVGKLKIYTAEGADWAIGFYQKLGYKTVGKIERAWGNDVVMENVL